MNLTAAERVQSRSVFFRAGQAAFLMAIQKSANPYNGEPVAFALWDKGFTQAQNRNRTPYAAEAKIATWLGYPAPQRDDSAPRDRFGRKRFFPRTAQPQGAFKTAARAGR